VSLLSFVMVGGYFHGILRSSHVWCIPPWSPCNLWTQTSVLLHFLFVWRHLSAVLSFMF
jgi:hypothetical protein